MTCDESIEQRKAGHPVSSPNLCTLDRHRPGRRTSGRVTTGCTDSAAARMARAAVHILHRWSAPAGARDNAASTAVSLMPCLGQGRVSFMSQFGTTVAFVDGYINRSPLGHPPPGLWFVPPQSHLFYDQLLSSACLQFYTHQVAPGCNRQGPAFAV